MRTVCLPYGCFQLFIPTGHVSHSDWIRILLWLLPQHAIDPGSTFFAGLKLSNGLKRLGTVPICRAIGTVYVEAGLSLCAIGIKADCYQQEGTPRTEGQAGPSSFACGMAVAIIAATTLQLVRGNVTEATASLCPVLAAPAPLCDCLAFSAGESRGAGVACAVAAAAFTMATAAALSITFALALVRWNATEAASRRRIVPAAESAQCSCLAGDK